eukprot:987468-Alexandrium_andersonii.AAC.1
MRQALDYPFNSLAFLKYYYLRGEYARWIEPETGAPVTADNRKDLIPAWTGVRAPGPPIPRDTRE